jgi:hypothetical protein
MYQLDRQDSHLLDPSQCSSGRVLFTSNGAVLGLSTSYTIASTITLDASALPTGVTLTAAPLSNHFTVSQGGNLTLSGITLRDGRRVSDSSAGTSSGSIIITSGGLLTANRTTFHNNTVSCTDSAATCRGGALYITEGKAFLRSCTFSMNTVATRGVSRGGAIRSEGLASRLEISGCSFRNNAAVGTRFTTGANGGAIDATNTPVCFAYV